MQHAADSATTRDEFHTPTTLTGIALIVEPSRRGDPITGERRRPPSNSPFNTAALHLMKSGRSLSNIRQVEMAGHGRFYRFPRNIAWKNFPSVSKPVFDYGQARIRIGTQRLDGKLVWHIETSVYDPHVRMHVPCRQQAASMRASLSRDLPKVDEMVIVAGGASDRLLWEAIAPVYTVNPNVVVWRTDLGNAPIRLARDEMARLELKFRAHDRLMYNYLFNMVVLGSRARFSAAKASALPHHLAATGYRLQHDDVEDHQIDPTSSSTPFVLQSLHEFAKTTDRTVAVDKGDADGGKFWKAALTQFPFIETCEEAVVLKWRGSGKYQPCNQLMMKTQPCSREPATTIYSSPTEHMHDLASLYADGFITIKDKQPVMTDFGRGFLDALGTDVLDSDLLLRWRTPEGLAADEPDIPSIEVDHEQFPQAEAASCKPPRVTARRTRTSMARSSPLEACRARYPLGC